MSLSSVLYIAFIFQAPIVDVEVSLAQLNMAEPMHDTSLAQVEMLETITWLCVAGYFYKYDNANDTFYQNTGINISMQSDTDMEQRNRGGQYVEVSGGNTHLLGALRRYLKEGSRSDGSCKDVPMAHSGASDSSFRIDLNAAYNSQGSNSSSRIAERATSENDFHSLDEKEQHRDSARLSKSSKLDSESEDGTNHSSRLSSFSRQSVDGMNSDAEAMSSDRESDAGAALEKKAESKKKLLLAKLRKFEEGSISGLSMWEKYAKDCATANIHDADIQAAVHTFLEQGRQDLSLDKSNEVYLNLARIHWKAEGTDLLFGRGVADLTDPIAKGAAQSHLDFGERDLDIKKDNATYKTFKRILDAAQ